jgi:hypothetical protein
MHDFSVILLISFIAFLARRKVSWLPEPRSELILPKPTVEKVLSNITAFVVSEPHEVSFRERLEKRRRVAHSLRDLAAKGTITENELIGFIVSDGEALNVLIAILGMSQEEFYRIVTLRRVLDGTFDSEWKMPRIVNAVRRDAVFAHKLADLLIHGGETKELEKHVPKWILDKLDHKKLLFDSEAILDSLLRASLKGAYDEGKGDRAADLVASLLDGMGVPYVDDIEVPHLDRKMDFVIPSLEKPAILIEVGVFVTTARELSEKGPVEKYIRSQVEEHYPEAVLVRIIDGIGWLARGGKALPSIIEASHYVLTFKELELLRDIVKAHIPKECFAKDEPKDPGVPLC